MERAKYATVLCCRAGRKHGRKTEQNGLSEQFKLSGFFPFLGFAFSTTKFKAFFFSVGYIIGFVDVIFVLCAGLSDRYVRSLDEAVGCISKSGQQNIRN